jgi:hypothetical protein
MVAFKTIPDTLFWVHHRGGRRGNVRVLADRAIKPLLSLVVLFPNEPFLESRPYDICLEVNDHYAPSS